MPARDRAPGRFEVTWRLEVDRDDPATLVAALAPESQGHHDLSAEQERLVATGASEVGQSLHTLDDLLACLTAGLESLEVGQDRDG